MKVNQVRMNTLSLKYYLLRYRYVSWGGVFQNIYALLGYIKGEGRFLKKY